MVNKDIRNRLQEDTIVFDSPSFDNSIIGMTFQGQAIYDLDKMTKELAEEDDISPDEALEFIEYNTIRTIPYIHSKKKPIIVTDLNYLWGF